MKDEKTTRLVALNLYDKEDKLAMVAQALSVKARRDILKVVNQGKYTINEIAWKLNMPISTTSFHIKTLAKAGLINYSTGNKHVGNEKYITLGQYAFAILLGAFGTNNIKNEVVSYQIPIGTYTDFEIHGFCGIFTKDEQLLVSDTPAVFYSPKRVNAGLIWFQYGFLEYSLPLLDFFDSNPRKIFYADKHEITSLSIKFELCSEAPLYDEDHKSDVDFLVNGLELTKIKLKGNYGQRTGRLNPDYLKKGTSTQYGLLYNIDIRRDGTYLNEDKVSNINLSDIDICNNQILKIKFLVKEDGKKGGLSIFGKDFGDYPQDISVDITYQTEIKQIL